MSIYLAEELTWRMYADELEMHDLVLEVAGTALVTILIVLAWRRLAPQHARNAISHLTRSGIAIILMAFTSAFVCGFCFWTGWANDAERLPAILEQDVTIELDLIGDPARRDYGYVSNAQMGDGPDAIRVRVIWPKDNEGLFAGHRIAVTGSVSVPKPDDSGRWNHQNGFAGTLRAMNVEELGCSAGLRGLVTSFRDESFEHIAALGGDAAGLLAGVLLGNKTIYADSELEQAFQTTGLAHLMAVSGTHLAIVTMLLSAVLARTPLRRGVRSAMLVAALVVYVAITGFAASAIRACTMCSVALVLGMTRQRAHVPSGLALCVFVFLGLSPPMAFSLGFQLSVLSVFGLVVFGAWASYWLAHALPRLPEFVSSSIAATLAASCLTLPVTVAQFAQLPSSRPLRISSRLPWSRLRCAWVSSRSSSALCSHPSETCCCNSRRPSHRAAPRACAVLRTSPAHAFHSRVAQRCSASSSALSSPASGLHGPSPVGICPDVNRPDMDRSCEYQAFASRSPFPSSSSSRLVSGSSRCNLARQARASSC